MDGCFGMELNPRYESLVEKFKSDFKVLCEYCDEVLQSPFKPNWKTHLITAHLVDFISRTGVSLGQFAEQTSEACHAAFKPTERRYCVNQKNPRYGERQQRAVIDFSSNNI